MLTYIMVGHVVRSGGVTIAIVFIVYCHVVSKIMLLRTVIAAVL
jgi:hypothetical protein